MTAFFERFFSYFPKGPRSYRGLSRTSSIFSEDKFRPENKETGRILLGEL